MRRWIPRFDWKHSQNWLPGVLRVSAVILLVVVAANSPTQTNSKPSEPSSSQSAGSAVKEQTDVPSPSQPALPQVSPAAATVAKVQTPTPSTSLRMPVATTGDGTGARPRNGSGRGDSPKLFRSQQGSTERCRSRTPGIAGRYHRRPAGLQEMSGMSFSGAGKTILGPSLAGIVGRKSAADANFSYSPAMKQATLTWIQPHSTPI